MCGSHVQKAIANGFIFAARRNETTGTPRHTAFSTNAALDPRKVGEILIVLGGYLLHPDVVTCRNRCCKNIAAVVLSLDTTTSLDLP